MAVSNCEGDWELEFVCQGAEEVSLDASYPASVVEVMEARQKKKSRTEASLMYNRVCLCVSFEQCKYVTYSKNKRHFPEEVKSLSI